MKKFALLLSVLLLFVTFAPAQTGGIKGKVRATDGDGISGATVAVRQEGDDIKSSRSDKKGNFLLEGLKPGKYNIVFSKSGFSSGLMYDIEIIGKDIKNLGDRLILTVDQGTQVIINGSVYNQDGLGIYGAKIKIEKILSDGSAKKIDTSYTSRSGEFTFKFPEKAESFRITASAKGSEASKEVAVEGAAIYRLSLILNLK